MTRQKAQDNKEKPTDEVLDEVFLKFSMYCNPELWYFCRMLQLRLLKLLIVVLLSSASFAKNGATTMTTCQLLKKRTKKTFNDVIIASSVDKGVNLNSTTVSCSGVFTRWDPTVQENVLTFYGLMLAGAVARSVAATAVHPLNVIKTLLQKKDGKVSSIRLYARLINHNPFYRKVSRPEMVCIIERSRLSIYYVGSSWGYKLCRDRGLFHFCNLFP